jgi:hypothetical protein
MTTMVQRNGSRKRLQGGAIIDTMVNCQVSRFDPKCFLEIKVRI